MSPTRRRTPKPPDRPAAVQADRSPSMRMALAVTALGVAALAAHAWSLRAFVVDDAFITFRYARNIAAGLGPVFNPGERVEGFSNPLLTGLLALIAPLCHGPEALPRVARALGLLAGAGTIAIVARLPLRGQGWSQALAALAIGASTSFALWTVGGLETVPYACLITATLAVTLAPLGRPAAHLGAGLLLAAITLSRPEGVVVAGAFAVVLLRDRTLRRNRAGLAFLLVAAVLPALLYLGFRRAYFGEWLPNTYFAKHIPLALAVPSGFAYLAGFFTRHGRGLAFLPALFALARAHRSRATGIALGVLAAHFAAVVLMGGDWMDEHRFVAPVVPLLSLPLAEGWWALLERARRAPWPAAPRRLAQVALAALAVFALVGPETLATRAERGRYWVNAHPYYDTLGRLAEGIADPDWSVAVADIGAVGWYGRLRVVDLLGLVNLGIAHGRTWDAAEVGGARPEIVVLHYDDRPAPPSRWRTLRIADFDAGWPAPRSPVPLPGALRVRADVRDTVEARLARLGQGQRRALVELDAWLATHQPDGLPLAPGAPRR